MSPDETKPGQQIPITTVPNFRDLGGWATPNGRVRHGMMFRSAEFTYWLPVTVNQLIP